MLTISDEFCQCLILWINGKFYCRFFNTHYFFFTKTAFYQCASVLLSLVSLSWSIVSYQQASRWATPEKPQMSPIGCWFQFLWKFFVIASRVMILSLFATEYKVELFIFIGLHWMMMTVWILFMVTKILENILLWIYECNSASLPPTYLIKFY